MTQLDPTTGMPVPSDDDDLDALLDPQDPPAGEGMIPRSRVRSLERKAREGESAVAENVVLARKVAFLEAGIDTTTAAGELFMLKYQGEATTEAVKAAWAEVAPAPAGESGDQGPTAEQLAQQQTRDALAQGGPAAVLEPVHTPAKEEAITSTQSAIKQGMARDEAMGGFVNQLANAAMNGDKSVMAENRG